MRRPILDKMAGEGWAEGTFEVRAEVLYKKRDCTVVLRWVEEALGYLS